MGANDINSQTQMFVAINGKLEGIAAMSKEHTTQLNKLFETTDEIRAQVIKTNGQVTRNIQDISETNERIRLKHTAALAHIKSAEDAHNECKKNTNRRLVILTVAVAVLIFIVLGIEGLSKLVPVIVP
jgi:uncharacterized coiled-coil DUF342 family protein